MSNILHVFLSCLKKYLSRICDYSIFICIISGNICLIYECWTSFFCHSFRMNFLSNILREEGGFDYKKAIVDSIVILIRDIPDAKESGLLHLCEFIEDCEFTYLSTQVIHTFLHYFRIC